MKSIPGSAVFLEDGSHIFTPYEKGKEENVNWLALLNVDNGKLECSKKRIRMVLVCDRTDLDDAMAKFTRAFSKLCSGSNSRAVKKMYSAAAEKSPHEIKKKNNGKEQEEIPTHGY